jgi:hypothetical protein
MPATSAAPRPNLKLGQEPTFWKQYSPRGEGPFSGAASVLLHVVVLLLLIVGGIWFFDSADSDSSKPPQIDVVEIEGEGGGLGGLAVGPGKLDAGPAGRTEGAPHAKAGQRPMDGGKVDDFKFKDLPKKDLEMPIDDDLPLDDKGDVFARLDRERVRGEKILASQTTGGDATPGFKGGDKSGTAGGAGGKKGPGLGNNKGPGRGNSPTGSVLTDQRRRELRWKILASEDGETHVKKLQALKVILLVPLRSKPGFALRFDLSKPTLVRHEVKAADDSGKVRWKNDNQKEMAALVKVLNLPEVPPFTVIYLPSDLEADMARRELAYQGRQENEIHQTVWDVRQRDGGFDNEPYIVQQFLRPGAK